MTTFDPFEKQPEAIAVFTDEQKARDTINEMDFAIKYPDAVVLYSDWFMGWVIVSPVIGTSSPHVAEALVTIDDLSAVKWKEISE